MDRQTITLDLAGHKVDASGLKNRLFILQRYNGSNTPTKLNIADSVGGGIIMNARQDAADIYNGMVIRIFQNTKAVVNLFGGTLTAEGTDLTAETDGWASTVYMNAGTFNLYGGTIKGDGLEETTFEAVESAGGTFNRLGGTIAE